MNLNCLKEKAVELPMIILQSLNSRDVIQMKTEINLQSHFCYGSSKFPNRPHPNRRQFLQKDKAVQACHEQHVKTNGTTGLKNERWILEAPKLLGDNSNREGKANWMAKEQSLYIRYLTKISLVTTTTGSQDNRITSYRMVWRSANK